MPVLALGAAAVSLATGGAAAIGAVVAGTATLATTLEAVGAVGAVVGAVGSVTGNKGLATAGLVLGGIGSVGSLAANAGVFGASATTESLFGSSANAASDLAPVSVTPNAFSSAADALNPVSVTGLDPTIAALQQGSSTDIVNALNGDLNPVTVTPQNSGLVLPTGTVNTSATPAADLGKEPDTASAPDPLKKLTSDITPTGAEAPKTGIINGSGDLSPVTVTPENPDLSSNPGVFGFLKDMVQNDKSGLVKYGLIQTAGSLIGGMFDTLKPAQVDALNAQAAANRAAAALTTMQTNNMSSPIPVASRVVPSAVAGSSQLPGGIINSTPGVVNGQVTA